MWELTLFITLIIGLLSSLSFGVGIILNSGVIVCISLIIGAGCAAYLFTKE